MAAFPSQTVCGKGRAGRVAWTLRWKRDNILFGLFCGIGKEREEGGVMVGCIYCIYVCASGGILWSYGGMDGYTLGSLFLSV
jgi:hypothetical protein